MGMIRKLSSLSSAGLISYHSPKEKTANAAAKTAKAEARVLKEQAKELKARRKAAKKGQS